MLPTPPPSHEKRKNSSKYSAFAIPEVPSATLPTLADVNRSHHVKALLNETEAAAEDAARSVTPPNNGLSAKQRTSSLKERVSSRTSCPHLTTHFFTDKSERASSKCNVCGQ